MRPFVLVTGASSGIGYSACLALSAKGYGVIAGIRNPADREKFGASDQSFIFAVQLDVTDVQSLKAARAEAERIMGNNSLVAIVNNAGIVVHGAVLYIPAEEWSRQLDVNVIGVIRTTQVFFPLLSKPRSPGDHHPRRIINMSSVSGLFASPFLGPYVASKFELEALSDTLRRELYMHDVQVVIIEPGNITTPIWEKARQEKAYFGPEYDSILAFKEKMIDGMIAGGIPVSYVDQAVVDAVSHPDPPLRYLIRKQKWKFRLIRLLPAKWVDKMITKRLRDKSGIRPF